MVISFEGFLKFSPTGNTASLAFETIDEKDGGSNFVAVTNIASSPRGDDGSYGTKILNYSATLGQVDDVTSPYTKNYESYSVGQDGLVTVTYDDGSKLTVKSNSDGVKLSSEYPI